MEGGLLLDIVVRERAAVLELLAGEDQALLVGRNTFLVLDDTSASGISNTILVFHTLNLGLDIVDSVGRLDLEGDGLARECLDEDLHDGLRNVSQLHRV